MKVIGLVGSPRSCGNTFELVNYSLQKIKGYHINIEIIELAGLTIQPCRGCDSCREKKSCALKDDLPPLLKKMLKSDGIIIGSPVYTGAVPGKLKAFLERTSYLCHTTGCSLERKAGAPIVVGGRSGQNFTHAELLMWFHVTGFYMVGSNYWNMAFGLNKGDVKKDKMAFTTLNRFIDNFLYLLFLLHKMPDISRTRVEREK